DHTVYVVDSNMIRKITPGGSVSTLAGRPGGFGTADGTGSAARFWWPHGIDVDGNGNVFVCDRISQTIRKISPAGDVITFAGASMSAGSSDGDGIAARFNDPSDLATDSAGFIYIADSDNSTIRKISPTGTVTTLAGLASSTGSTDGTGSAARFKQPAGVAIDGGGFVYVADTENSTIRKITPSGDVSTLAGLALHPGSANGNGSAARFNRPEGMVTDATGNLYVADTENHTIRKISPSGDVTTLAGVALQSGSSDGSGSAARFNSPRGIAVDVAGNLYVSDTGSSTIRKITPSGFVTTVAGSTGKNGSADGSGSTARFSYIAGLAVGNDGRVYISDMWNHSIRLGVPALPDMATIDVNNGPMFVPRQLDTAPQTATQWTWTIMRRPSGSTNDLSAESTRNPIFVPDTSGLFTFRLHATAASVTSITTVDLNVPAPPPVDLGPPTNFSATTVGTSQVALTWTPVSGATHYEIFRSFNGGPFVLHNSCPNTACSDAVVASDTTYLYKVRAIDDGGPSSFSIVDAATTTAFSDHPLSVGIRVKANHLLELRVAVNAMRVAAGLSSATFTTTVALGAIIQADAITELRSAVDAGRSAIGLPPMDYVDATLIPQVTSTKVAQLRQAVE
ncbi:MAG TPA: SMP-30/gluconolactonase/LRE family protein, partial [Thermoanaerobaculia bacterium]|nr:SMP-30/gluconolactonase/LRE family protein [Thermoanaerobaculia bacterium]